MEGFIDELKAKSGETVYLCAFCVDGKAEEVKGIFADAVSKADFTGIKHHYYIEVKLYDIIKNIAPDYVPAMGIGIIIKDSLHIGGGIIGNPHEESESADDKADYIGNGFWCTAFAGRYGAVYKCGKDKADIIAEKIDEFNKKDIITAVEITRDYLKENTEEFLMLADGSGKGAYPYCACFAEGKFFQSTYKQNM